MKENNVEEYVKISLDRYNPFLNDNKKEIFIPKTDIKAKIEEIEIEILDCEYADDDTEERKKDIEHEKTILLKQKEFYKKFLESEE